MRNKQRFTKISLILGCFTFFLSSYDFFESGKLIMGITLFFVALTNAIALIAKRLNSNYTSFIALVLNAIAAIVVTIDKFIDEYQYQQYLWIFISILYVLACFAFYFKRLNTETT